MAFKKSRTYLDTDASGLVIIVEHNSGGTPDVFLTEWDGSNEVYVSLMDARIAEIKVLDKDNVQFTFASTFKGYAELVYFESESPSQLDRIVSLEDKYLKQFELIEDKVSKSQWTQMNTLLSAQIEGLQGQVANLQSQINSLKSDVDAL